ncbi:MAG: UbiA prenyltransferase family protein [Proteobacteria bacterium]|nr:UbiA prenyltransferase family protein [Pseudomonadota bacterium]MBU4259942.1 UbiA prenyltransferase family protein [Pseudomonadota bacterium]MBU4286581.1 UbiA prenyltransferase family protein [Pseudomonadota bacterium]MCG2758647.1 UbiA prenyltransferase family protein [Desulfobacteraceae bacterium]
MNFKPYIKIARPDHWFKNVFMLPGVVFAFHDSPYLVSWEIIPSLLLGLAATCLVASSNYTINEILDAPKDAFHPVKKKRPIPSGLVNLKIAYLEWVLLGLTGLVIAWQLNFFFFLSLALLLIMGLLYNVPPIRLKDLPYLDVLSESINNPIRLLLGWFIINKLYPPTLSLIMAYWMIGAFFMAVKRYAEYRCIADKDVAVKYRKSFSYYNEYRLILSMVYYASAFSLFFGIFLIRYRVELILSVPFMAGFIPMYMRLAFWDDSPAQYPEKLYKQRGLVVYSAFCLILVLSLLFIDIPLVGEIFSPLHIPGE